jgi:hypothetical protein
MMIDTVWIAFSCGIIIGSCLGILCLGLVSINRDTKLRDTIWEQEDRIKELETTRQLLKGEIFRISKSHNQEKDEETIRKIQVKIHKILYEVLSIYSIY